MASEGPERAAGALPGRDWRPWLLAAGLTCTGAALAALVHPVVGVAVAAGLVAAPFVLRDINLAFAAVVAVVTLMPFAAIPLGIGFNPTFLDLALGALYAIWLVRLATRRDPLPALTPLGAGVVALIAVAMAALLAGLAHGAPTKNQLRVFGELVLGAGLYFVVSSLIVDRPGVRKVMIALVAFAFAAALVGLGLYVLPDGLEARLLSMLAVVDYPTGPGVIRYLNDDPTRLQRATGMSIDPNSFGGLLAASAALVTPQIFSPRPMIGRRRAAVLTAGLVAALLATVSRGSLLGFAAAVVVIGLLVDRRALAAALGAAAGLVVLSRFLPWTQSYVAHFTAGVELRDLATRMRLGEYRDALRLIRRYPLLGVGFGSVRDVDLYRGVSSLYLIIAETMGLAGLGVFVTLMAGFGGRLLGGWLTLPEGGLRAVVLGCLAALVAALVSGVFDHYFFTYPHAFALLWLILGLGTAALRVGLTLKGPGLPRARPLPARRRR